MSAQAHGAGGDDPTELRVALEAEVAHSRRWRDLAEQRGEALAEMRRRPLVRAAVSLDRRTAGAQRLATAATGELWRRAAQLVLTARGVLCRPGLGRQHARWEPAASGPSVSPVNARTVTVVVVGHSDAAEMAVTTPGVVEVLGSRHGEDPVAGAARSLLAARGDTVCLISPTTVPASPGWLARLVDTLGGDVVAAAPMLVHPHRRLSRATPHDGRIRSLGFAIDVSGGVPTVRAREAGRAVSSGSGPGDVVAGSAGCILLDRHAAIAAGGLGPPTDPDAALIELCTRLTRAGGRVRTVPDAMLSDGRPVTSMRELTVPVEPTGPAWRGVLDRVGPLLVDATAAPRRGGTSFVLTVASPSAKVATRWGDWHLADALARSLVRAGHTALVQTADHADDPAGRCCDVRIVLRGLAPVRRTPGQRHVLWVISHPESLDAAECDAADLVLVASTRFAEMLRRRTSTPVEVFLQATDHHRFGPRDPDPAHRHPVTIVAKSRDQMRPMVADAIAAGLRPAIYGSGWSGLVPAELVVAEHMANEDLPVIYSSASVVLNDHWETMAAWGFVSNRVFDVLACGTPLISDELAELGELFDDAVVTVEGSDDLAAAVAAILDDPVGARDRAARGRETVLAAHTFDHRAAQVIDALARHGLDRPPGWSAGPAQPR